MDINKLKERLNKVRELKKQAENAFNQLVGQEYVLSEIIKEQEETKKEEKVE